MCRVFGFRSVIPSQVHTSLVGAENALMQQSENHRDGWGVAYYVGNSPHVIKSASSAINDSLFAQVSGIVSAETVVAHIRKSTQGDNNILNTHPFQFGKWIFAHNGNVKNFHGHRHQLISLIDNNLKRYVLGETDSEVIFFILLSNIGKRVDLHRYGCRTEDLFDAIKETVDQLTGVVGQYSTAPDAKPDENFFTFVLTNGHNLVAHQGGKELLYSTYKSKCSERSICPSFAPECESPTANGYVNHLIVSSETLSGQNIWLPMRPGDVVGVDWNMKLQLTR